MKAKEVSEEHQELLTKIGAKLKSLRKERGMTYIDLAKEIGVSRNGYNQMENGRVYFNIASLLKVLDHYDIDIEYFIKNL